MFQRVVEPIRFELPGIIEILDVGHSCSKAKSKLIPLFEIKTINSKWFDHSSDQAQPYRPNESVGLLDKVSEGPVVMEVGFGLKTLQDGVLVLRALCQFVQADFNDRACGILSREHEYDEMLDDFIVVGLVVEV